MTSTAIVTRTTAIAAIAVGAFFALHRPASAAMSPTLETATDGVSSWTYTAGATDRTYTFGAIQDTDWLGSSEGATATSTTPGSLGDDVSGGSTPSVPEPSTLALLGLPLLLVAGMVHRRRRR